MRDYSTKDVLTVADDSGTRSDGVLTVSPPEYRHGLQSLLELTQELSTDLDLYSLAQIAIFSFMGQVGTTKVGIWLFPEDSRHHLVLLRVQGIRPDLARAVGKIISTELGDLLSANPRLLQRDVLQEAMTPAARELFDRIEIAVVAPLVARGRLIGVMATGQSQTSETYDAFNIEVMRAATCVLASALDNSRLHSRMLEGNRQLRLSKNQLESLDYLKSEFINTLDHELRTPLAILIAYLDIFETTGDFSELQSEHLDILSEQAHHLNGLIGTLLDWKGLMESDSKLTCTVQSLSKFLREYHRRRLPGVTSELREFRLDLDESAPPAEVDESGLEQILDALVDNAQKFTPQGSELTLRLRTDDEAEGSWLMIEVEDNGPGIPPERQGDIFDSFRQVEPTLTRTHGGIGMGLAMARKLSECMGGSLDVESVVGKGTRFQLRLPAVDRRTESRDELI